MRLDKFLAESSKGTKKVIHLAIREGHVTVNQQVILLSTYQVDEVGDKITYHGEIVKHTGKIYYMFHKPAGCITARKDEVCKTVLDYFHIDNIDGLFPVGRLDKDTEGLLLLTNDGIFNHKLMHPDEHVEKTYFFWAYGTLSQSAIDELLGGICLGENLVKAVKVEVENEGYYMDMLHLIPINNMKELKSKSSYQKVVSAYITIEEGKKHQVKRMLKAVGCYIGYLKRVSIGNLKLDETLDIGHYRELTNEEMNNIIEKQMIE